MRKTRDMTRRSFFAAGAAALALAGARSSRAAADGPAKRPDVVVELFTSQGCSACPPVDALLAEIARIPGVLAISYNIDAWDYLGWRDTLARPEFTRRQRMYAKTFGAQSIYTPQLVIDGRHHVEGYHPRRIRALVERQREARACQQVPMSMRRTNSALLIDIGEDGRWQSRETTLWLVSIKREVRVRIRRGENRGREIAYHNVARGIVPVGMWHGARTRLSLPRREIMMNGADLCAALLQEGSHGPVIAAAAL